MSAAESLCLARIEAGLSLRDGLEAEGCAVYLGVNGWVLTPDGRRAATEHFAASRVSG